MREDTVYFAALLMIAAGASAYLHYRPAMDFRKRMKHVSWMVPLALYLLLVAAFNSLMKQLPGGPQPPDDNLLGFLLLAMPFYGIPVYLAGVLAAWQFIFLSELYKGKRDFSEGWWAFFIVITLINVLICYLGLTSRSGFLLTLGG